MALFEISFKNIARVCKYKLMLNRINEILLKLGEGYTYLYK